MKKLKVELTIGKLIIWLVIKGVSSKGSRSKRVGPVFKNHISPPCMEGYTMTSDAQKRANRKYQKEKTKQLAIRFSPNEMDMLDYIKSNPEGIAPYIKRLVREDMERG